MADEIKATFFGVIGAVKIQGALERIARKVKGKNFNCLEVTAIVAKHFLVCPTQRFPRIRATSKRVTGSRASRAGRTTGEMVSGPGAEGCELNSQT